MMTAFKAFLFFTLITGVVYPLLMTASSELFFKRVQEASIRTLVGQKFEKPEHFWGRPSAIDYHPMPSGGSNLGPTSAALRTKLEERKKLGLTGDLLFASGSGLDPHIRPESARLQADRVAKTRNLKPEQVLSLIEQHVEPRQFGILGEPRVNVVKLNHALKGLQ